MAEGESTSRIYCNICKGTTRHILVASKDYGSHPEEGPAIWGEYRLWSCAGCDTCTMEDYYTAEYMVRWGRDHSDSDTQIYESIFHPKRASSSRPTKHFVSLPAKLGDLYSEIIASHNEGQHILCAAGLRSLLEGVCAEKGISGANLEQKIEGMKSFLPESIVKNLHEFRFMGNRAVHELEAPESSQLGLALDVIEDILNFVYALDYKASLLAKARAARGADGQAIPATLVPPSEGVPPKSAQDAPDRAGGHLAAERKPTRGNSE